MCTFICIRKFNISVNIKILLIIAIVIVAIIVIAASVSGGGGMSMGPSITEMYENKDCGAFNNYLKTHTPAQIKESLTVAESSTYFSLTVACASEIDVTNILKP